MAPPGTGKTSATNTAEQHSPWAKEVKVISPSSTSSYWGRENHSKAPDTHPGKQGPSTRPVTAREPGTDSRLQTSDQGRLRLHLSEGPGGSQDMQMCC